MNTAQMTEEERNLANQKARRLLQEILPDNLWQDFEKNGLIRHHGNEGTYVLSPRSRTILYHKKDGRFLGSFCLIVGDGHTPGYDRLATEYLMLINDERWYRKKAFFFGSPRERERIRTAFMFCLEVFVQVVSILLIALILMYVYDMYTAGR